LGQQKETNILKVNSTIEASWNSVDFEDYIQHDKVVFNKMNPLLCFPEISNIMLDIYPACMNEKCKAKLNITLGAKIVTCTQENCKKLSRIDKCRLGFNCLIDFENSASLNLPADILEKFIGEEISTYQTNTNSLFEKKLFFENIDYRQPNYCNGKS